VLIRPGKVLLLATSVRCPGLVTPEQPETPHVATIIAGTARLTVRVRFSDEPNTAARITPATHPLDRGETHQVS
jgi:hypothetical protein